MWYQKVKVWLGLAVIGLFALGFWRFSETKWAGQDAAKPPVKQWLAALRDHDAKVRERANVSLRSAGPAAIHPLIDEGLASDNKQDRQTAEEAIANVGGGAAWSNALEALDDVRPAVQVGAERVLNRLSGASAAMAVATDAQKTAKDSQLLAGRAAQDAAEAKKLAMAAGAKANVADEKSATALTNSAEAKTAAEAAKKQSQETLFSLQKAKEEFQAAVEQERLAIAKAVQTAQAAHAAVDEAKAKIDEFGANSKVAAQAQANALEALRVAREAREFAQKEYQVRVAARQELKKAQQVSKPVVNQQPVPTPPKLLQKAPAVNFCPAPNGANMPGDVSSLMY